MKDEVIPCPVCGSTDFTEIIQHNNMCGPGYFAKVVAQKCNNCGVLLDPNRKCMKEFH